MFKWTHYSKSLVRAFGGVNYHSQETGLSQAILQHYGWRSFFIDATKSPAIACWFAANKYCETREVHLCEDFEENPVQLVHRSALYEETSQPGHLYVVDPNYFDKHGLSIYDLTSVSTPDSRLRFNAQSACLLEVEKGRLPPEAIVAHLIVEHAALVGLYQEAGIRKTEDLFPGRNHDFILNALLEIPWERFNVDHEFLFPTFKRGLDLPEYDIPYVKHLGSLPTLYQGSWIADDRDDATLPLTGIPFFRLPEFSYYANTNEIFDLSEINKLLETYPSFAVEIDGLIKIPELGSSPDYEKGIVVNLLADGHISVAALEITHPGHVVGGIGVLKGWIYRPDSVGWVKVDHPDQCPCNNELRHILQFSILRYLNESIKDGQISQKDDLNFWHEDTKRSQSKFNP